MTVFLYNCIKVLRGRRRLRLLYSQYNELIPDHWFDEYKKENTTNERRKEILEETFRILRSINEFPEPIISLEEEIRALRSLETLDPYNLYDGDYIELNSVGVTLCTKFYPNIHDVKKQKTPYSTREGFYDDDYLKRCIKKIYIYGNSISDLVGWLRIGGKCGYCNNFRPSAAKVIYDTNLKNRGSKVYDYAAGYGGRLLGSWAAEKVEEYVAVDPNTETHENALKFSDFLLSKYPGTLERVNIYKVGSEDFTVENFPQYKDYFDIAFSSPQYFNTEIYSFEETQSCFKFNSYERWVKGFLRPTIFNCIEALKHDGIFAINIFANLPNIKKIIQYICNERDFKLYKVDKLSLQVMPGTGKDGKARDKKKRKFEPIFYFKHKDYI